MYHQTRQISFFIRHLSCKWILLILICLIFSIAYIPNPFASEYSSIRIVQNVEWNSIKELLETKERLNKDDTLSKQVKFIQHGTILPQPTKPMLILLYTTVFLNRKYCTFTIERIFGETCPSKDLCQWSCDRRQLSEADAIVFHAPDIQYFQAQVPERSQTKRDSIWILWSDEPPTLVDYSYFNSYEFNWTISYKLTSEISIGSYGLFTKRRRPLSNNEYNQWIYREFTRRVNGALWFVSNCKSQPRLDYYYTLRREDNFIVDGYGRCVDYYPVHLCTANTRCELNYMLKYKYYLSFESTKCRDYITEKFYKAFYHGLIPIVYGPSRKDYENLAPTNSFIHIDEFEGDMHRLTEYLHLIHSNRSLYSMYHQWRKNYEVIIDGKALERIRMCELCERLNRLHHNEIIYYKDLEKFYREKCD